MACFVVPAAEAVITTIATKVVKSKEKKAELNHISLEDAPVISHKIPFSRKMKWLNTMLWGGSALLAFEHLWHGELVPYFPFLTGALDPAETSAMLREMATTGVGMAVLVTAIWGVMVGVSTIMEKRSRNAEVPQK